MSAWQDLTEEQLEKLSTHRLLNVLRQARKKRDNFLYQHESGYCDSVTLAEADVFFQMVKKIADSKEHITRKHVEDLNDRKAYAEGARFNQKQYVPQGNIKDAASAIGKQVYKSSKKPFKSKNFYNTVSSVTTNPHTGLEAFAFEEDTSIVDVYQCNLRKEKK